MGSRDGVTTLADDVLTMLFEDDPMYAALDPCVRRDIDEIVGRWVAETARAS